MTLAWTQDLRELVDDPARNEAVFQVDPNLVINWAVWEFGVSRQDLLSDRRQAMLVFARSFVVWALRHMGEPRSYPEIGRILGGRNSSSALHLHQKALSQIRRDKGFAAICHRMRDRFLSLRTQGGEDERPSH